MTSQPFIMPDPLPHDSASDDPWDEFDEEQSVHSGYRHYHSGPPSAELSVGAFPQDASLEGPRQRRVQTPPIVASGLEAARQPPSPAAPSVPAGAFPDEHPSQAEHPHGRGQIAKAVVQLLSDDVTRICAYVDDALGTVLRLAKTPVVLLLLLTLVVFVHLSAAPVPAPPRPGLGRRLDPAPRTSRFRHVLDVHGRGLQMILDDSAAGPTLDVHTRRAMKDLSVAVRGSKLVSREPLADMMLHFAEDAYAVGGALSAFGAAVNRAFEDVVAVTDHAFRSIEAAGAPSDTLMPKKLWPFYDTEAKAVGRAFTQVADVLARNMHYLLDTAQLAKHALDDLDRQLAAIHTLVLLEHDDMRDARDDVLASLWTRLGGNRRGLRQFERHLELLESVGASHSRALDRVVRAQKMLQDMNADIEGLRARVAAPALAAEDLPLEVHLASIRMGLQRLQRGRLSTVQGRATIGDA